MLNHVAMIEHTPAWLTPFRKIKRNRIQFGGKHTPVREGHRHCPTSANAMARISSFVHSIWSKERRENCSESPTAPRTGVLGRRVVACHHSRSTSHPSRYFGTEASRDVMVKDWPLDKVDWRQTTRLCLWAREDLLHTKQTTDCDTPASRLSLSSKLRLNG